MLRLTIIESPPDESLDSDSWVVGPSGATLGRVKENTWTLPDRQSVLSRKHCEVLCEQGSYVLLDNSVNGTFLDGSKEPIGKGQKAPLKNGSTIHLGGYILLVSLETANGPSPIIGERPAFLAAPGAVPEIGLDLPFFSESPLMPESNISSTPDPLPFENVEPSPLSDNLFTFPPVPKNDTDEPLPKGKYPQAPAYIGPGLPRQLEPAPVKLSGAQWQPQNKSDADFPPDDWYISPQNVDPAPILEPDTDSIVAPVPVVPKPEPVDSKQPEQVHHNERREPAEGTQLDLDTSLRQSLALVLGDQAASLSARNLIRVVDELAAMVAVTTPLLMQALASRSQFKDSLRLNQTMVRARNNNPLKPDVQLGQQEALQHMLLNDHPGLLHGRLAMEEGFRELATHQTALLAALRPALLETMTQLSPRNIQATVGPEATPAFLLPKGKGKLWDTYLVIYAKMTESGHGSLEQSFMRSLAQHYEASLKNKE